MKWSKLPKDYKDYIIKNIGRTDFDFQYKCFISQTIDELPPIPQKEFIIPEKWCVQMEDPITDRNVYFHNPSLMGNHYFSGVMDSYGYTEITYDQWVKYVRDTDTKFYGGLEHIDSVNYKYKENALKQNNNLEKIKEMRDVVNDKDQEHIESFYMIYVDGASGSTRKHDYESACKEAQRLSKETDKKVFILRSEYCFERKVDINLLPIKKD